MWRREENQKGCLSGSLEISDLYKQDYVKVANINAPIEVLNISKSGIASGQKASFP